MTTQHTVTTDHGVSIHHFLVAIDADLAAVLAQARAFAMTLPPQTAAVQVEKLSKTQQAIDDDAPHIVRSAGVAQETWHEGHQSDDEDSD